MYIYEYIQIDLVTLPVCKSAPCLSRGGQKYNPLALSSCLWKYISKGARVMEQAAYGNDRHFQ